MCALKRRKMRARIEIKREDRSSKSAMPQRYGNNMKVKSYRTKLLMTILPIMAIVFCAISMIMNTRADGVFTPPEIVESISYMVETPTEGSPTDYTPLENFAFCNWQIYNAAYKSQLPGNAF